MLRHHTPRYLCTTSSSGHPHTRNTRRHVNCASMALGARADDATERSSWATGLELTTLCAHSCEHACTLTQAALARTNTAAVAALLLGQNFASPVGSWHFLHGAPPPAETCALLAPVV